MNRFMDWFQCISLTLVLAVICLSDFSPQLTAEEKPSADLFEPGNPIPIARKYSTAQIGHGKHELSLIAGVADVFGNGPYDLFLAPHRLFPFLKFDESTHAPLYGKAITLTGQPIHGSMMSDSKGQIFGVFGEGQRIRVSTFDRKNLTFETLGVSEELNAPGGIGLGITSQVDKFGKFHVYFTVGDGIEYRPPPPNDYVKKSYFPYYHEASYMPYDGAGFWRGNLPRRILYQVRFDSLQMKKVEYLQRIGEGPGEFLFDVWGMTVANLGKGKPQAVITSEKPCVFRLHWINGPNGQLSPQQYVNNEENVAFRHHVINPSVKSISDPHTGLSNLVIGDSGRLWFSRFSGNFTPPLDSPIYETPIPLQAEGAPLALGELPVISTGDVDGDGQIDLIAGNDAGELLFVRNIGAAGRPEFDHPVAFSVGGRPLDIKAGYRGSIQGPGESMWGYTQPALYDWSRDGRLDVVLNSIMGDYVVLLQLPRDGRIPKFSEPKPLYCDGMQMHLAWRTQPGITDWGLDRHRICMIAIDEQNLLRQFWRVDNQNLERGELLTLKDGSSINANIDEAAGQTGRGAIIPHDFDGDGAIDLLIGTSRGLSFPASKNVYYPSHFYPNHQASVLFLRNVGTNEKPVFDYVRFTEFEGKSIGLGIHTCSPAVADFGNGRMDLLVGEENGSIRYYPRPKLSVSAALP